MKILIELDERTARELEAVAPGRQRRRSEFIRWAIRRALDERTEREIEAGYRREPPSAEPWFDAAAWSEWPQPTKRRPRRKRPAR